MILRTFNCTIVNQIKSSKKLVVKLKIRNLQLLQMKPCRCFRAGTNGRLCHRRVAFLEYALVRSWFHVLKPRMSRNFLGGFYQPGKPLPVFVREEIVDLYNNGVGVSEISRNTRVTKGAVHKVVQHFALHGTTQPFSCGGSEPILITNDILEVIEIWKLRKPSLYASEIRERLLREGICTPANGPSIRQIQTVTNKKLGMTYKKLTSIPSENLTPENLAKVDDYLNITSRLKRETLHFFDKASVISLLLSLPVIACLVAVIEDNQRLKFKDMHETPTTR